MGQKGSAKMSFSTPDLVLAAAQAGDPNAVNQLITTHRMGVYRYGLRVCRTTEDAEDAVQETLWAATRAIRSFRGTASSLVSWLFTIVRRECHRLIERRQRAPASLAANEDELLAAFGDLADDEAALRAELDVLAAAIAALDPLQREVVLLRDIEERSAPEVAARLGISTAAVKSRLHRARASLRELVLRRARTE